MNNVNLVGRIANIEETDSNSKTVVTVAISRDYKDSSGIYETDLIPCVLWNGVASATKEYCQKGDVIGIKGKIQMINNQVTIVADKVTFISSNRNEEK